MIKFYTPRKLAKKINKRIFNGRNLNSEFLIDEYNCISLTRPNTYGSRGQMPVFTLCELFEMIPHGNYSFGKIGDLYWLDCNASKAAFSDKNPCTVLSKYILFFEKYQNIK